MAWFEQLETHLHDLYLNCSSHAVDAFKPAFYQSVDITNPYECNQTLNVSAGTLNLST
ncbi:hypothetical protein Tco_1248115, partial [Tanacetum coccineum]